MVKLVYCCRRNPALSREEFQTYWLDRHGPLVRSIREQIPQMLRYVQSHALGPEVNDPVRAGRGADEAYDGITEVWFEDVSTMGSTTAEAVEAGKRLFEDEAKFLDFARCSVFVTEEHEIF